MKKIAALFTLVFGLSLAAEARSMVPQQEQAVMGESIMLDLDGNKTVVHARTSLDNYGELRVLVEFPDTRRNPVELRKSLGSYNFEHLRHLLIRLSNVELVTRKHQVVCMMMPPWGDHLGLGLQVRKDLSHQVTYSGGDMREILSPRGCWVPYSIRPLHDYDNESARALQEALRVLRNEVLVELHN
jgi:hypothetical protein